jgi:preprotein translocase subunit SecE
MNSQTEEVSGTGKFDSVLLAAAALLLVGGMGAFYYYATDLNVLIRTMILLAACGAAVAVAYQTAMGKLLWTYIAGSRVELRKVVWPTRQESVQTTLMIAVVVLIMSLILWGLDSFLLWGVKHLTGRA